MIGNNADVPVILRHILPAFDMDPCPETDPDPFDSNRNPEMKPEISDLPELQQVENAGKHCDDQHRDENRNQKNN